MRSIKRLVFGFCLVLALSMLTTTIAHASSYANSYSVIFSGGYDQFNNHDRYYEETLRIWELMTGPLGYDASNVYVLFADGLDPAVDRSSGVNSNWSMISAARGNIAPGTGTYLQAALGVIGTKMTSADTFSFWSFDHGYGDITGTTPDTGGLSGWGDSIADDMFASWLAPIWAQDPLAESYAFGQCFAGDMVNELNILPGENRFAAWAAAWDEYSWGRGWVDAWADGIELGLTQTWDLGAYARLNDPFGPLGTGQETPGWIGANFSIAATQPVPEPSTFLLLGSGMAGLLVIRRKRG